MLASRVEDAGLGKAATPIHGPVGYDDRRRPPRARPRRASRACAGQRRRRRFTGLARAPHAVDDARLDRRRRLRVRGRPASAARRPSRSPARRRSTMLIAASPRRSRRVARRSAATPYEPQERRRRELTRRRPPRRSPHAARRRPLATSTSTAVTDDARAVRPRVSAPARRSRRRAPAASSPRSADVNLRPARLRRAATPAERQASIRAAGDGHEGATGGTAAPLQSAPTASGGLPDYRYRDVSGSRRGSRSAHRGALRARRTRYVLGLPARRHRFGERRLSARPVRRAVARRGAKGRYTAASRPIAVAAFPSTVLRPHTQTSGGVRERRQPRKWAALLPAEASFAVLSWRVALFSRGAPLRMPALSTP